MKKTGSRKLQLNRETIAELTPDALDGVVGGKLWADPPTWFSRPRSEGTKTINVTLEPAKASHLTYDHDGRRKPEVKFPKSYPFTSIPTSTSFINGK